MTVWVRVAYAILLVASVAIAWSLIRRRQKKLNLTRWQKRMLGMAAFVGATLGAKVPFLGDQGWSGFLEGTVWFADGKTILGGIVGGYFAVEIAKRIANIRVRTGDSFALPVAVAVGVGRIGCFIAGCCYGQVTTLPWGVHFPVAMDPPSVLRHPTQLYEVTFHAIAAVALVLAGRHGWFVGNQLKVYLIAYLIYRFFSEWLRPESKLMLNLTIYQLVAVLLIAVLIGLWMYDDRSYRDSKLAPDMN
jgi:phosphatidylglycerol:prolipoprotein diacylglycerol transferase